MKEYIYLFWGKAERGGTTWHPAVCHMLDVGIMARELVGVQSPDIRRRLGRMFGAMGVNGLSFFAALHDIGKISPGFQAKRKDLSEGQKELGFDFPRFAETLHGKVCAASLPYLLSEELNCSDEEASLLSHVLAAHHGVFVTCGEFIDGNRHWEDARRDIVRFMASVFQVKSLDVLPPVSAVDAMILSGLLTLADWLGSSEENFPYSGGESLDIPSYVSDRTERAKDLIGKLHMGAELSEGKTFRELFGFDPNACQQSAMKVASRLRHPMLLVVESPTGTGKTEASQALYASISAYGDIRGLYCALPTQATGNAMFFRMLSFLEKLKFKDRVELHLIHANADLHPQYEALKTTDIEGPGGNVIASSWFTARKRGLLAAFGVGTIDQALLAVLKVHHFTLRLFGLAGKMLILDEVHAYDTYMSEEINRLIGWLSHCDTSIVLLSATLPLARRKNLLQSFFPHTEGPDDIQYPCVIGVDRYGNSACEEIRGFKKSKVVLNPVVTSQGEKTERIIRILSENLMDGGCAACILNTVSEAQALFEVLRGRFDPKELILFHSRFTLERRLEIEKEILTTYGKDKKRPYRGIVVATQVLEQSLDVDFDLMISDLAPIDLILQRAGRLHRHKIPRKSLLRNRILHVMIPDAVSGQPDFGGSRYVYFPYILSRTLLLFLQEGIYRPRTVDVPYGIGPLIEEVYGEENVMASPHLKRDMDRWLEEKIGKDLAAKYAAQTILLSDIDVCFDDPGYLERFSNDNDDDRVISTRMARQTVTLVVLEKGAPLSVQKKNDERTLYGKSVVTDNLHLVGHYGNQEPPEEWRDSALLRHCRPLLLDGGILRLKNRFISYDDDFGLQVKKKEGGEK